MTRLGRYGPTLIVLSLFVSGCWSHVSVSDRLSPVTVGLPRADAILAVNEAGFPAGHGEVEERLALELMKRGLFRSVHYRVEPREEPAARIKVAIHQHVAEYPAWGVIASLTTGLLLFLPLPIMPYFKEYELAAEIDIRAGDGHEVHRTPEENMVVTHALLASPSDYQEVVLEALTLRLADDIAGMMSEFEREPSTGAARP